VAKIRAQSAVILVCFLITEICKMYKLTNCESEQAQMSSSKIIRNYSRPKRREEIYSKVNFIIY
jgi:hypothetical protein